jgi:cytochrome c peroxidase
MSTWTRFSTAISIIVVASVSCRDAPTASERVPLLPRSPATVQAGLPFSEELAELGDEIFDDSNLSLRKNQACNSCHLAEWGFTGPDPAINAAGAVYAGSIPTRFGDRKPPSSAYSTLSPVLEYVRQAGGMFVGGSFWDGRATGERLGSAAADQAQGPFLNPMEQALPDAACVVYRVSIAPYADDYVHLWGSQILTIAFPPNTDDLCGVEGATVPLSPADRAKVTAEYANIAISIAVYEQSHNLFSSKFDAARIGSYKFTPEEQRGFALFQGKGQCARCHVTSGQQRDLYVKRFV